MNSLFYNCKGIDGNNNEVPLNITRSFFKCFPNVTAVANMFGNVKFSKMLTYDFFYKRKNVDVTENIYVLDSDTYKAATLHTVNYGTNLISNMNGCFRGAKFVDCECWFNPDLPENIALKPQKEVVEYNGNTSYTEYYMKESSRYIKYKLNDYAADTLNNFTNYVEEVNGGDRFRFLNHNLNGDLTDFKNLRNTTTIPFNTAMISEFNISPTYCCLPPDILHCCYFESDLTNVFADTNIIGVIPQHLIEKCYKSKIQNMLANVNILPNLVYHYDSNTANNQTYLDLISSIPIDNDTIMNDDNAEYTLIGSTDNSNDATVLFRNSDGELRRRNPYYGQVDPVLEVVIDKDFNKSQFAYVPQGYTKNTNLEGAFTFRYNLPEQVDLYSNTLSLQDIEWSAGNYDSSYSPENRPDLWPYYTQYFFTTDESTTWDLVRIIKSPFISDEQDVSFEDRKARVFSTDISYGNRWWYNNQDSIYSTNWDDRTNGIFNVFLNLCGKRNKITGQFTDYGLPVKTALINKLTLSYIVNGILSIFLNGKIFEESVDGWSIVERNSDPIINYAYGFGRNMIFPNIYTVVNRHPTNLLNYPNNSNVKFYKFMFPNSSYNNYKTIYGNAFQNIVIDSPKYIVR